MAAIPGESKFGERRSTKPLWGDLLVIIPVVLLLVSGVLSAFSYFTGPPSESLEQSVGLLWANVAIALALTFLLPMGGLALTVHGGFKGILRYVGITTDREHLTTGLLLGVAMFIFFSAVVYAADVLGLSPEYAPIEDQLANITWPLVIFLSLAAGIGEEFLFRGILNRWITWWGQGLLFASLHLGNAGWFSFFIILPIGLGFGLARHRGASLTILIVAHVMYDLLLLSLTLLFPDIAGTGGTA